MIHDEAAGQSSTAAVRGVPAVRFAARASCWSKATPSMSRNAMFDPT
jgi:hypothetical protein